MSKLFSIVLFFFSYFVLSTVCASNHAGKSNNATTDGNPKVIQTTASSSSSASNDKVVQPIMDVDVVYKRLQNVARKFWGKSKRDIVEYGRWFNDFEKECKQVPKCWRGITGLSSRRRIYEFCWNVNFNLFKGAKVNEEVQIHCCMFPCLKEHSTIIAPTVEKICFNPDLDVASESSAILSLMPQERKYEVKLIPRLRQTGNVLLLDIGRISDMEQKLKKLSENKSNKYAEFSRLLKRQREDGMPILMLDVDIGEYDEESSKFLDDFNFWLDYEVARRLVTEDPYKDLPLIAFIDMIIDNLGSFRNFTGLFQGEGREEFAKSLIARILKLDPTLGIDPKKLKRIRSTWQSEVSIRQSLECFHQSSEYSGDEYEGDGGHDKNERILRYLERKREKINAIVIEKHSGNDEIMAASQAFLFRIWGSNINYIGKILELGKTNNNDKVTMDCGLYDMIRLWVKKASLLPLDYRFKLYSEEYGKVDNIQGDICLDGCSHKLCLAADDVKQRITIDDSPSKKARIDTNETTVFATSNSISIESLPFGYSVVNNGEKTDKPKFAGDGLKQNGNNWYQDVDVRSVLEFRLPEGDNFTVIPPAAAVFENNILLNDAIKNAVQAALAGNVVAMPMHLHDNHWVGAIIFRQRDNGPIRVIYNDPMGQPIEKEPNTGRIVQIINNMVHEVIQQDPVFIDLRFRQQFNGVDCGPFTVDNLIRLAEHARDGELDGVTERYDILSIVHLQQPADGSAANIRREHENILRDIDMPILGEAETGQIRNENIIPARAREVLQSSPLIESTRHNRKNTSLQLTEIIGTVTAQSQILNPSD